ncbi:MAG: UDP-N-acetylglucosamine 2-epimerase (non-hydrolyzing) [Candidatus Acidiferrales bacterium]
MKRLRIMGVVGARPNFMKIAPLLAELRKVDRVDHLLVHSGQHYGDQMSDTFFRDLELPEPDINLEVGSGSHAWQTAEVIKRLEPVAIEWKPQLVLVVGDVNSTLAASLVAVKLGIRLAHIEAGLRSFDMSMPEEINRKVVDAISDFLFVTEDSGVRNLQKEGVPADKIFMVGNVMIDTLLRFREVAVKSKVLQNHGLTGNNGATRPYAVLTLHRPANVDDHKALRDLLEVLGKIAQDLPILFPMHPRSEEQIRSQGLGKYLRERTQDPPSSGILAVPPLGYLDFLCLMDHARLVLTDSGGIQEETTVLGIPCLTLRENTERPVTVEQGTNEIVGRDLTKIMAAARRCLQGNRPAGRRPPLWDGKAAGRIVKILLDHLHPEPLGQE